MAAARLAVPAINNIVSVSLFIREFFQICRNHITITSFGSLASRLKMEKRAVWPKRFKTIMKAAMQKLILLLAVSVASLSAMAAGGRPNIVFILADDLGIGDVNCYGGDRCLIETPNIDALAAEGLRFTDAHPSASVCSPTRRAIMTGRYNWRFGSTVNSGPWGFVGPRPNTEKSTLGKLLKRSGYRTGYVGKWHLGTTMPTLDGKTQGLTNVDFTQPLTYGPAQFGFDESFILPGSLDHDSH